ncbi:fasciclin domain-containing protein [Auraticoccus monumenti]|uniref:Uncaracterized surface protein containing fasciclin (FAS1) repeats n=1 Tax=Auraticoccus monumenti TaxID=675864 RepID=A0A1G6UAG7_9ACTN|nr:fasciclin domain-containing protein [Auraticoccus monumenti]SDD38380.1 Uncaracterized surface protein containing fasciclin (FAS1) repeats [Auraticoccus monumenti]
MFTSKRTRTAALTAAFLLPLAAAACGTNESAAPEASGGASDMASAPASSAPASPSSSPSDMASSSPSADMSSDAPFGAACSEVPTEGEGSVDGMSDDPVATAASNNPLLTTLVAAVTEADLGDTLNSAEAITVFAPIDSAFEEVPADTMDAAMGDPSGLLTDVLTAHVVGERLSPDMLAGEHETLNPDQPVTVEGSGEDFTVNGEAMVVCGNVQTANATVYLIDTVLLPAS